MDLEHRAFQRKASYPWKTPRWKLRDGNFYLGRSEKKRWPLRYSGNSRESALRNNSSRGFRRKKKRELFRAYLTWRNLSRHIELQIFGACRCQADDVNALFEFLINCTSLNFQRRLDECVFRGAIILLLIRSLNFTENKRLIGLRKFCKFFGPRVMFDTITRLKINKMIPQFFFRGDHHKRLRAKNYHGFMNS